MPLSLRSSSLNSSRYDSQLLRCTSYSKFSEAVLAAMLIKMLCQNALDLICSSLRSYFERCQIHLPTVKHLFPIKCCDSNLRSFFSMLLETSYACPWLYCFCFSCWACCKSMFQWWLCVFLFFPTFHVLIWIYTFYNHQRKCFMTPSILAG